MSGNDFLAKQRHIQYMLQIQHLFRKILAGKLRKWLRSLRFRQLQTNLRRSSYCGVTQTCDIVASSLKGCSSAGMIILMLVSNVIHVYGRQPSSYIFCIRCERVPLHL